MRYFLYNHSHHMMGHGFDGGGIMALLGLLFFIFLVVILIKMLVHAKHSKNYCKETPEIEHKNQIAMDILNERFAKGEINKEDYEEKKKTLMS